MRNENIHFFRNIFSLVSVTETKIPSCNHSFVTNKCLQNLLTVSLKPSYALDMIPYTLAIKYSANRRNKNLVHFRGKALYGPEFSATQ